MPATQSTDTPDIHALEAEAKRHGFDLTASPRLPGCYLLTRPGFVVNVAGRAGVAQYLNSEFVR